MNRPFGIVLISVGYILCGSALVASAVLFISSALKVFECSYMYFASAVYKCFIIILLLLILGIGQIIVGYKLLKGSKYAYYIVVALSLIDLISAVFNKSLGGALFASAMLIYLMREKTRQYFLSPKKQPKTIVENYLNTKQNEGERVC